MAQKKVLSNDSPFLKAAAEAIGTTLGRLAIRTGVITPPKTTKRKKAVAPQKRTVASKTGVATRAKKPARKTSR